MKNFLHSLIFLMLVLPVGVYAQCPGGETEVSIVVHTDNWGSEVTWELTGPLGTPEYISGGPYSDNTETHVSETICVPIDAELVFKISDSFGDGICSGSGDGYYTVSVYDFIYASGCSFGDGESTTFYASVPPSENAELMSLDIGKYLAVGDNIIKGRFSNQGTNNITAIDINWQEDGGSVNAYELTGIDVAKYGEYDFTHDIPFNISTAQITKDLKVWLSDPNGITDENPDNDTIEIKDIFILSQAVKRRTLIEHYTNAGCSPCASQNPVLEALSNEGNNPDKIAHIAYHTSGPGYDPMNIFNADYDQGSARADYYGITGVPTAIVAGKSYEGSPVGITQSMIDAEYNILGEFKVVPEITFSNDSLFVDIELTSLKSQSTGTLKTFVVLVEDMEYTSPPGTNGEKSFPDAMRYMLSGVDGEDIGLPVADAVVDFSCKMPFHEEIGKEIQMIVFIQNTASKEVLMAYQINEDFVPPIATFEPANNESGYNADKTLSISFNEDIRLITDETIVDPDTLVYLRIDDFDGDDVPFASTINDNKIELIPTENLESDKEYYYGYKAYIEDVNDQLAEEKYVKFVAGWLTGIDLTEAFKYKVYPNPASEWINLEMNLTSRSDIKIRVYNELGQLIKIIDKGFMAEGNQNIEVDMSRFSNGLYFINLSVNNKVRTKKIHILK
jgi:thiol-disulfide isomerase/thioredoxin